MRQILLVVCVCCMFVAVAVGQQSSGAESMTTQDAQMIMQKIIMIERQNSKMLTKILDLERKVNRPSPATTYPATVEQKNGMTTVRPKDPNSEQPLVIKFDRSSVDKSPLPLDAVPEWELSNTIGGRHVIDPESGQPVYALSEWRVVQRGKAKVIECIRLYGRPVPVGAVFYGSMKSGGGGGGGQRRQAAPTYQFGNR